MSQTPRGIRNNNPGNIRHGAAWDGRADIQEDESFITFQHPMWGIRALIKILMTYNRKYKIDTVQGIISRWAPPVENNTDAYSSFVCARLDVYRDKKLDMKDPDILIGIAKSITIYENGLAPKGSPPEWYTHEDFENGLRKAGVSLS